MKGCINHTKLWSVLASAGLLLAISGTGAGFTGHCGTCHGAPGFTMPTFHTAENLICAKCHTMHYSEDGTIPADAEIGGPFKSLLLKASSTDVCLLCHQGPLNDSGAPIVLTLDGTMGGANYPRLPGGDFYYSQTDQRNGHNPGGSVILSDTILTQSPGGTFAPADETCTSCHDPHGGSPANDYRLLKKIPAGWTGGELIVTGLEAHPGSDEGGEGGTAPGQHTISNIIPGYYSGFSAWCGSCHSNPDGAGSGFHGSTKSDADVSGDGVNWFRHPTDLELGDEIAGNYSSTNDYDWEHPIEDVDASETVDSTDEVFCLSCHRVHGTPYFNSTRWDGSEPAGAGVSCNKCHAKG